MKLRNKIILVTRLAFTSSLVFADNIDVATTPFDSDKLDIFLETITENNFVVSTNNNYFGEDNPEIITISTNGQTDSYFNYTGNYQTFTVPSGVRTITIKVWGAQGGSGGYYSNSSYCSTGGKGGYAEGDLSVTSGSNVYVYVGGEGGSFETCNTHMQNLPVNPGGWNGGGDSYGGTYPGTGGGGASDVRYGGTSISNRKIVAGGGGGGGNAGNGTQLSNGGAGGGESGQTMSSSTQFHNRTPGTGATQNSGNSNGVGSTANQNLSGGGGGGYYGGGIGNNSTGGGGGSGYIGGCFNAETIGGNASMPDPNGGTMTGHEGNGLIIISYTEVQSNTAPTASAQSVTGNEDSPQTITLAGSDAEGDALTYALVTNPSNGTATLGDRVSLNFDGSGDYVQTDLYLNSLPYTITCRFKSFVSSGERSIVDTDIGGHYGHSIILGYGNGDNTIDVQYHNGSYQSPATYSPNTWYTATATYENGLVKLYVDGNFIGSKSYSQNTPDGSAVRFGRHNSGDPQWFNGLIDEVAIWGKALTASEISAVYNSGNNLDLLSNSGDYTSSGDLEGYWNFNEGEGTTLTDQTSNGNNGTINGATWSEDVPPPPVYGCTDSYADNYAPDANVDDGSCSGYPDNENNSLNFSDDNVSVGYVGDYSSKVPVYH